MSDISAKLGPELQQCDRKRKRHDSVSRKLDSPFRCLTYNNNAKPSSCEPDDSKSLSLLLKQGVIVVDESQRTLETNFNLKFSASSADPSLPPYSTSLLSIRNNAEKQVHKDMQQMVDCFLHMPDNEDDVPAWCRRARSRCAAARTNSLRARWLQLALAYIKLDAARRSPSPSVISDDDGSPSEFSDEDDWRKYTRETSSVEY